MSLLRKGILAGGGSIACAGLGVLTNMMLARALLPEGMGRYQVPYTGGVLIMTVLNLGIGQSNIYFLNKHRVGHKRIVMNSVWFGLVGWIFLLLLMPVLLSGFQGYFGALRFSTQIIFAVGVAALFCFNLLRPVLTADLKIHQDIGAQITNKFAIFITVAFGFILGFLSADTALMAISLGHVVALVLVIYFLKEYFDFNISFSWKLFKETLAYGLKLFAANVAYLVNVSLGLMLVRYLMPDDFAAVGYYGRATALCGLIMLFPVSVGPLLYAQWSSLSGRRRNTQVEFAMRLHFASGAAIVAVLIFLGPWMITILYGKPFLPAVGAMRVLAFGVAFRCIFNVCNNLLAGDGRAHITACVFGLSMIVTAILTCVFVPYIGIIGAALADVITSFLVFAIGILLLIRSYGLELKNMLLMKKNDFTYLLNAICDKRTTYGDENLVADKGC